MHAMRLVVGLALIVATLTACGCGGGSTVVKGTTSSVATASSTTPTDQETESLPSGRPLTRAQLIAAADMICRRVNLKRSSIALSSLYDYKHELPELAAYEQAAVVQMRRLIPPASMASIWRKLIAEDQTVAEGIAAVGAHATQSGLPKVESQSIAAAKTLERSRALAKREGFDVCAQTR